jgi:hypothetical protein
LQDFLEHNGSRREYENILVGMVLLPKGHSLMFPQILSTQLTKSGRSFMKKPKTPGGLMSKNQTASKSYGNLL